METSSAGNFYKSCSETDSEATLPLNTPQKNLLFLPRSSMVKDGHSGELHQCNYLLEWGSVLHWKWSCHPLPCAVSLLVLWWYCAECNNWWSGTSCFWPDTKYYVHIPSGCSWSWSDDWTIQQSYQYIPTWSEASYTRIKNTSMLFVRWDHVY